MARACRALRGGAGASHRRTSRNAISRTGVDAPRQADPSRDWAAFARAGEDLARRIGGGLGTRYSHGSLRAAPSSFLARLSCARARRGGLARRIREILGTQFLALGLARGAERIPRATGQRSSARTWTPASHRQRSRHAISALGSARGTEQLLRLSWSSLGLPGRSWQLRLSWILQRVPAALGASRVPWGFPGSPGACGELLGLSGDFPGLLGKSWELHPWDFLELPVVLCGFLKPPGAFGKLLTLS